MGETPKPQFVLLGAGLPRNGTLSTRAALRQLLRGDVYHMLTVMQERHDHHPLWKQALDKTITKEGWRTLLGDYVAGVDYPVSHFYKEILRELPDVKVLLNVRDPVRWYESVRDSILALHLAMQSWPCNWFNALMGTNVVEKMMDHKGMVPTSSSAGLDLFGAVSAGQEAAVQFYQEHVEEVKRHVPSDKLLVFEVKQGWGPLCAFLNVPIPENPFPRVNDTEAMNDARRNMQLVSWLVIVIFPVCLVLGSQYLDNSISVTLVGYLLFLLFVRLFGRKIFKSIFDRVHKQKSE